jgi:hypothetical protein
LGLRFLLVARFAGVEGIAERLFSTSGLPQGADNATPARKPQKSSKSKNGWRAIQNKTANSYVIEIIM